MEQTKIMVIDDEQSMIDFLTVLLEDEGYGVQCFLNPDSALEQVDAFLPDLILCDVKMEPHDGMWFLEQLQGKNISSMIIMMTAYISVEDVVEAVKKGAYDYITKPFNINELRIVLKNALAHAQLVHKTDRLSDEVRSQYQFDNFVGNTPVMVKIFDQIRKSAGMDSTVLITGESGTGKELVAKAIHYNSPRKKSPFISIDCSAIPATLLESELFGHMKGSFTGADKTKIGLFEAAGHGSVFLDEIGDMPYELQSKLLRVLQEREVRKIGSTSSTTIYARIIAATNRDLINDVRENRFREDLFFRLNILNIELPSLAERKDDIPIIVNHFLNKLSKRLHRTVKGIDPEAVSMLMAYDWPGNVRELENAIERALILNEDGYITTANFPEKVTKAQNRIEKTGIAGSLKNSVEQFERQIIEETLKQFHGNQFQTAKQLKLTRQNLQYKLKKYGLLRSNRHSDG